MSRVRAMCFDEKSRAVIGVAEDDPIPPIEGRPGRDQVSEAALLYRQHALPLRHFVARRSPTQDVMDFVQESFARLFRSPRFQAAPIEAPGPYLRQTAFNLILNEQRSRTRHMADRHEPLNDDSALAPDLEAELERRDLIRRIDKAIGELKPRTREIFLMQRVDGMSYNEIAELKGIGIRGVEEQIATALREIRRKVGRIG